MYYPYLRGKRHELSALRKTAPKFSSDKFAPVIEPVKANLNELISTVDELNKNSIVPLIIVNPIVGELSKQLPNMILPSLYKNNLNVIPCILFNNNNCQQALQLANQYITSKVKFTIYVNEGLSLNISHLLNASAVNIIKDTASVSAAVVAATPNLVILKDPFPVYPRNADYPNTPNPFSDAHLTFKNNPNQIGFGDFTIVGETWSENGGPARAVAIHITYINSQQMNMMYIKHCVSTINSGSVNDPASKFLEALQQLMSFAQATPSLDQTTIGFQSFVDLYNRKHYPNLGPVKENSIMHHMETIVGFL